MTKVTILGEATTEQKKLKPIEFVWLVNHESVDFDHCNLSPSTMDNIELIQKGIGGFYDVMFGYTTKRELGSVFLGHFNDGVVE